MIDDERTGGAGRSPGRFFVGAGRVALECFALHGLVQLSDFGDLQDVTWAHLVQDRKGASSCPSREKSCSGRFSTQRSLPGPWLPSLPGSRRSGRRSSGGSGIASSSRACRVLIPRTRSYTLGHLEQEDLASLRAYVIEALRDPDAKVRVAACHSLANQDVEVQQLLPVLGAAVDDESPEVRLQAAACLGKVSAHVARPGQRVSGEPKWQESETGRESLAVLCRLLKDQSSDVRIEAARSLAMAGPAESSTSALVAAAGDPDRGVRLAIAEALLRLNGPGDRTAAKILCDLIADPGPVADRPQILKVLQRASDSTQDQAMAVACRPALSCRSRRSFPT